MINKRIYNVAIIGSGRIAGLLEGDSLREHPCTHAGLFSQDKRFRIIALMGIDQERTQKFAKVFKIPNIYYDIDSLLAANHKIDILSICTPAFYRLKPIKAAIESGVKYIFCEKPIAQNITEAKKIISLSKKYDANIMVNYTRRYGWDYQLIKQTLLNKKIGKITSANATFSGNILHTGTHMLDVLHYLFGSPKSVNTLRCQISQKKVNELFNIQKSKTAKLLDPGIQATISYKNKINVFIEGLNKKYFIFELDIFGENGRIKIGNHLLKLWTPMPSEHYQNFIDLRPESLKKPSVTNPWLNIGDELFQSLTLKKPISSTAQTALKNIETAYALVYSHYQKEKIYLPKKTFPFQLTCY